MKTTLRAAALAASIALLGGCTISLGGDRQVTVTAADVKAAAQVACATVPTAEQITAAVDAANKTAASVESVAKILCAALAPVAPAPAPSGG